MLDRRRRIALLSAATATVALAATGVYTAVTAHAAAGCQVTYTVPSQWPGGFTANIVIQNLGDPINGWTLQWSFSAGQTVAEGWAANYTQNGSQVTATNMPWNASIDTGASVTIGFNGTWNNSSNPTPATFTLNGTTCTGSVTTTTTSRPPTTTTSQPPTTTTSQPPTTTTTTSPPPSTTGLIGWATLNGGTTGGAGGQTVTVNSLSELISAASSSAPLIIRVNGNFTCSDDVRVASNKTILGVGSGSGLTGCGLNIRRVRNVIVRNMRISFVRAGNGNGDAIHIDNGTNIWIDHNELFSDTSHGTDYYDGLLDCTHACDYVTVSWNYFHDHIKCSLVGHSDSNASEDTGHLRITYHHNYFNNCRSRNPRVRFANPLHVFNNYYVNIGDYAIASTQNAGVLVEGNYFENTPDPFHLGEGSSGPGSIVARNNVFVNSGSGQAGGSVASIPYSYTLDNPANVKSIVMAGAGTGRIQV